jgi:hypothetical protein
MAKRNRNARRARAFRYVDFEGILGRFSDARCVLESAVRSLEESHDPSSGVHDEAVCLRHGVRLIDSVYSELDVAILAVSSSKTSARR